MVLSYLVHLLSAYELEFDLGLPFLWNNPAELKTATCEEGRRWAICKCKCVYFITMSLC